MPSQITADLAYTERHVTRKVVVVQVMATAIGTFGGALEVMRCANH
jgi:hypothetical protein